MALVERFLKYVSFDTQSSEETRITPSTPGQMVFAKYLKSELESLGLEEITLDEHGYLFATLPANTDKEIPTIGFIAHMDTSPDMSGKDVTPRIVENYNGSEIVLDAEERVVLSPAQFPELLDHKGEDLIVTKDFLGPGTEPLTRSKLFSASTRTTTRFWTVIFLLPMCPGMCFPLNTLLGSEQAPFEPAWR